MTLLPDLQKKKAPCPFCKESIPVPEEEGIHKCPKCHKEFIAGEKKYNPFFLTSKDRKLPKQKPLIGEGKNDNLGLKSELEGAIGRPVEYHEGGQVMPTKTKKGLTIRDGIDD